MSVTQEPASATRPRFKVESHTAAKDYRQGEPGADAWARPEPRQIRSVLPAPQRKDATEFADALRLVQRASAAIDILQDRCHRLEHDIWETNERFRIEAESTERVIKDWENLATALKDRLAKAEHALGEANQKLKASEEQASGLAARAQASETRAETSEMRAREAEAHASSAEQMAAAEADFASSFRRAVIETLGSDGRLSSILAGDPA